MINIFFAFYKKWRELQVSKSYDLRIYKEIPDTSKRVGEVLVRTRITGPLLRYVYI